MRHVGGGRRPECLALRPSRAWKGAGVRGRKRGGARCVRPARRRHEGAPPRGSSPALPCTPIPQSLIRDPTWSRLGSSARGRAGHPPACQATWDASDFLHPPGPAPPASSPLLHHIHTLHSGHRGGFAGHGADGQGGTLTGGQAAAGGRWLTRACVGAWEAGRGATQRRSDAAGTRQRIRT